MTRILPAPPKSEWSLSTLHKSGYGNLNKAAPDPARCCASVKESGTGWPRYHQCARPRGFGPEQAYCKQHDPSAVAAKTRARDARYRAEFEMANRARAIGYLGGGMIDALRKIAAGASSPAAIAEQALAKIDQTYWGDKK